MSEVQELKRPAAKRRPPAPPHNDEDDNKEGEVEGAGISDVDISDLEISEPEEQDVEDPHRDDEDNERGGGARVSVDQAGLARMSVEEKRELLRRLRRDEEIRRLEAQARVDLRNVVAPSPQEQPRPEKVEEKEEDEGGEEEEVDAKGGEEIEEREGAKGGAEKEFGWIPYRSHNLVALRGRSLASGIYNRAPLVSPLPSELPSSTEWEEEEESEVLSEAAAYVRAGRERRRVVEEARERGGVVGLRRELAHLDFLCPHCLRDDFEDGGRPLVAYSCCERRAHYSCVVRNHCSDAMGRRDMVACIQCMRPADLPPHETVLEYYAAQEAQRRQQRGEGARGAGLLWDAYEALAARLKRRKVIERMGEVLRTEDRSAPPEIDVEAALERGLKAHDMLQAGWALETLVGQLGLADLDDPMWGRLEFSRNTLLDLDLPDLLFFMRHFEVHPYELRRRFDIRLHHLWRSAERRKARGGAGRRSSSRGASRPSRSPGALSPGAAAAMTEGLADEVAARLAREQAVAGVPRGAAESEGMRGRGLATTEALCDRFRSLSPRKLAVLGFDLHHMIAMDSGFVKTLFRNFHLFTMRDWVEHLGFRRPHWTILQLDPRDFTSPHGVFRCLDPHGTKGWRLDVLMTQYWAVSPDDLRDMGIVTTHRLASMLAPPPPAQPRPRPQRRRAAPPPAEAREPAPRRPRQPRASLPPAQPHPYRLRPPPRPTPLMGAPPRGYATSHAPVPRRDPRAAVPRRRGSSRSSSSTSSRIGREYGV